MITYILIALAAIFKAIADTLDDHFDTSVFKNLAWQWWDANRATTKKFWFTGYKFDAWHISNSLMIVCFIIAASIHQPLHIKIGSFEFKAWGGVAILIYGLSFNVVSNLFYTHILRRK